MAVSNINSQMGLGPADPARSGTMRRGVATDVFVGYEQMAFVQRAAEKFAAREHLA